MRSTEIANVWVNTKDWFLNEFLKQLNKFYSTEL
jgi:hypothetical protein